MGMTRSQLAARLEHGSKKRIAEALNIDESYVGKVASGTWTPTTEQGRVTERRIQGVIALTIGELVDAVFPLEPEPADAEQETPQAAAVS